MDVERRGLVLCQLAESMWNGKELSGGERSVGEMDCGAASEAEGHLLV